LIAALAFVTLSANPVLAQSSSDSSVEPGKIEDRVKTRPVEPPDEPAPEAPELPPAYVEPDGLDEVFILTGVEITGTTVYPISDFAPLYEDKLASAINTPDIEKLIKAITQKYRDDGYFLATAIAEPQDLALGVLRIKVNEGAITKVTYTGDVGRRAERLEKFAAKIKAERPARLETLERYMLLIDDLPGATVDGSLKPIDKDKGEFELVLAVEHKAVDGYASIDNRGTRAVGEYQALISNNLNLGFTDSERTGLTIFTIPRSPKELVYGELVHEQSFGTEGLKAWVSLSHSEVDAGYTSSASDLGSRSSRIVLGTSYPFIRSRDQNLILYGKIDLTNQLQNENDVRISDDRLRMLRIAADYNLNDDFDGRNEISVQYTRGLDVLGASDGQYPGQSRPPSVADGHVEFNKVTATVSRRQRLGDLFAVQVSLSGQKSDERLLSGEQYYIGGSQYGRAYDSGEISGDDAAAASAEIQFGQFLSWPFLDSYQIYGFYDFGVVWEPENKDFHDHDTLSSTGGGIRIGFTKSIFGGFEVAQPLTRAVANEGNDKGTRMFFYLLGTY